METSPRTTPPPSPAERLGERRSPLLGVTVDAPMLSSPQPRGLAVVHGQQPERADAALPLGPRRWLAVHEARPEGASSVVDVHGGPASAVDVSHGMTRIRVSGPEARRLLATGVAIDLHPASFPAAASAATSYRDVFVVLHAVHDQTLDVYVMRSFAASLWQWLADAATGMA